MNDKKHGEDVAVYILSGVPLPGAALVMTLPARLMNRQGLKRYTKESR
ncbi:hypothetical protein ACI48D_14055 [Massilia sp. LXY-6]